MPPPLRGDMGFVAVMQKAPVASEQTCRHSQAQIEVGVEVGVGVVVDAELLGVAVFE